MSVSGVISSINPLTSTPTYHYFFSHPSIFGSPFCDFEGLCSLPIEEALVHLHMIATNHPSFFIDNYQKFPLLSTDQAIPLLRIIAEKDPRRFARHYVDFPTLSADQAIPFLRMIAETDPRGFSLYYPNFPTLSEEQALSVLTIVAETDPSVFPLNYPKSSALFALQVKALQMARGSLNLSCAQYTNIKRSLTSLIKSNLTCLGEIIKENTALLAELTQSFLKGELKTSEDIPLIEVIIQYSHLFEDPSIPANIENILRNASKETAYAIVACLSKYRKDLCLLHFAYIFNQLTTTLEGEISPKMEKSPFFEASETPEIKNHLKTTLPIIWEEFCAWENQELRKKDGEIWTCISREKQPVGYIYRFAFPTQFMDRDRWKRKNNEIHPAIESTGSSIIHFLQTTTTRNLLERLGYSSQGNSLRSIDVEGALFRTNAVVTIPDREALLDKYDQFRHSIAADLPELSIISSAGVASDTDFVQALLHHDGIISNGREFFHDHFIHIVRLLHNVQYGRKFYAKIKNENVTWIRSYVIKIDWIKKEVAKTKSDIFTKEQSEDLRNNLPIIETVLAAMVDTMASQSFHPEDMRLYQPSLKRIIANESWAAYFLKRYPREEILPSGERTAKFDQKIVTDLAQLIDELEIPVRERS